MADTSTRTPGAWALEARGLGKRYRRGWALRDCSFRLPAGRICGLVGSNGAGKSTLLALASRQVEPTDGELRLFGVPVKDPAVMPRFAFFGQAKPLYKRFTVAETLRRGSELNPGWDAAAERIVRSATCRCGPRSARSTADSAPGSRSRSPSASGPICCCSTSRCPISTHSPVMR